MLAAHSHITRPCYVKVCNSNVGGGLFNLVISSDVYALSGHGRSGMFLYSSRAALRNIHVPSFHIAPNFWGTKILQIGLLHTDWGLWFVILRCVCNFASSAQGHTHSHSWIVVTHVETSWLADLDEMATESSALRQWLVGTMCTRTVHWVLLLYSKQSINLQMADIIGHTSAALKH